MGVCVKTLKKMYKQFDIPQRLRPYNRPDIYFDVKEVIDSEMTIMWKELLI